MACDTEVADDARILGFESIGGGSQRRFGRRTGEDAEVRCLNLQ
jgi:hypothetical protein